MNSEKPAKLANGEVAIISDKRLVMLAIVAPHGRQNGPLGNRTMSLNVQPCARIGCPQCPLVPTRPVPRHNVTDGLDSTGTFPVNRGHPGGALARIAYGAAIDDTVYTLGFAQVQQQHHGLNSTTSTE